MNTHRHIQAVVALLTLQVALGLLSHPAEARTWLVEPDGSGDAPTIQAAADSSALGDSILVQPGMYVEQVVLADGTSLIGSAGAAATTIDGDGVGFGIMGSDVLIQGLTLFGVRGSGYGFDGYAILSLGESEVRECSFEGTWGGVIVKGDLVVTDSEFRNGGQGGLPAIHLQRVGSGPRSLDVDNCLFESWREVPTVLLEDTDFPGETISCEVRDSVFRGCFGLGIVGYEIAGERAVTDVVLLVENNLFEANDSERRGMVGPLTRGIIGARGPGFPRTSDVTIRGNTFVAAVSGGLGQLDFWLRLDPGTVIENNVFVGNPWGVALPGAGVGFTVSCNLAWNNDQNWVGIPDPTGVDGNLSEPPLFCDFAGGNFMAASNSPLLAANNSCGVQIGAFGQGCGPVSVVQTTWGRIKGMYRE